ncbi:MAG: sigma-70 family RNA polymerase sigma factor [Planctomycetales bacterium]|nr:sigma-70 family RNA polymerase sigma factor [Planctomycetales bacterium]
MIRPLSNRNEIATAASDANADVDILRETLLAIGRIPMLSAEEEERLAHGIKLAQGRLRQCMLQSVEVVAQVAALLERVAAGEERLDRMLDVTLAQLKGKQRLRAVARMHAETLRGIVHESRESGQGLSNRQVRKVQRLADEALVRTRLIEEYFAASSDACDKRCQLARERYESLRNRMVAANLRLAVSIAKKYQHAGVPLLDLIQEGSEGLIRAAEKFKPSLGFKFSTYSVWWIQQRIRSAVTEKSRLIRIGEAAASRIRRMRAEAVEQQETSPQGLAFEDLPLESASASRREELRKSFYVCRDILSLDSPLQTQSGLTHADALPAACEDLDGALIQGEQRQAIGRALQGLTPRECEVLRLRFGLEDGQERNLAEVGRILDISRERVRQIEQVSLKKLRLRLKPEEVN